METGTSVDELSINMSEDENIKPKLKLDEFSYTQHFDSQMCFPSSISSDLKINSDVSLEGGNPSKMLNLDKAKANGGLFPTPMRPHEQIPMDMDEAIKEEKVWFPLDTKMNLEGIHDYFIPSSDGRLNQISNSTPTSSLTATFQRLKDHERRPMEMDEKINDEKLWLGGIIDYFIPSSDGRLNQISNSTPTSSLTATSQKLKDHERRPMEMDEKINDEKLWLGGIIDYFIPSSDGRLNQISNSTPTSSLTATSQKDIDDKNKDIFLGEQHVNAEHLNKSTSAFRMDHSARIQSIRDEVMALLDEHGLAAQATETCITQIIHILENDRLPTETEIMALLRMESNLHNEHNPSNSDKVNSAMDFIPSDVELIGRSPDGKEQFMSPDCDKTHRHEHNLRSHSKTHTEVHRQAKEQRKSLITAARQKNSEDCKAHHRKKHMSMRENVTKATCTPDKQHKCHQCNEMFPTIVDLVKHTIYHSKRPFKCPTCDSTFIRKSALQSHSKTHTKVKELKCTECDLSFECDFRYKDHIKKHNQKGENPLICSVCNLLFQCENSLFQHSLTHTEDESLNGHYEGNKNQQSVVSDPTAAEDLVDMEISNGSLTRYLKDHQSTMQFSNSLNSENGCDEECVQLMELSSDNVVQDNTRESTERSTPVNDNCSYRDKDCKSVEMKNSGENSWHNDQDRKDNTESILTKKPVHNSNSISDKDIVNVKLKQSDGKVGRDGVESRKGATESIIKNIFTPAVDDISDKNYETEKALMVKKNEKKKKCLNKLKMEMESLNITAPCLICNKTFSSMSSLRKHMIIHTNYRPFKCLECNKSFCFRYYYKRHLKSNIHATRQAKEQKKSYTTAAPHKCLICYKIFVHRTSLQRHHTRHHTMYSSDKPFKCIECNKSYYCKDRYEKHLKTHTDGYTKPVNEYRCPLCNGMYSSKSGLQVHIRNHTGERPYKCSICSKAFSVKSKLKIHSHVHSEERTRQCLFCGKSFKTAMSLKRHKEAVHPQKDQTPLPCSFCGKLLYSKQVLKIHQRVHTTKKHECAVCSHKFSSMSALRIHSSVHTGERKYQCSICGNAFGSKTGLRRHMEIHSLKKSCMCSVCGKTFRNKYGLKNHMSIHTGEKPYKCKVCSKAFRTAGLVTNHMESHTGNKREYLCYICGKVFKGSMSHLRHMRIHTGEKPYKCSVCGFEFNQGCSLQRHMKTHSEDTKST